MREMVLDLVEEAIVNAVMNHCPEKTSPNEWKLEDLRSELHGLMGVDIDFSQVAKNRDEIMDASWNACESAYRKREEDVGDAMMRQMEAFLYLQTIDGRWKDHLQQMDHLREGIHMRSYGQKDPKQEYKKDGYKYFTTMMAQVRDEVLTHAFTAEVERAQSDEDIDRLREARRQKALLDARREQEAEAKAKAGGRRAGARPASRPAARAQTSTPIPGGAAGASAAGEMGLGGGGQEGQQLNAFAILQYQTPRWASLVR